jgi:hypothetical protein
MTSPDVGDSFLDQALRERGFLFSTGFDATKCLSEATDVLKVEEQFETLRMRCSDHIPHSSI